MRAIRGLYCRCHDCQGARYNGGRARRKCGVRGLKLVALTRSLRREGKRGLPVVPRSLPCG